jgi:hypothetical protein
MDATPEAPGSAPPGSPPAAGGSPPADDSPDSPLALLLLPLEIDPTLAAVPPERYPARLDLPGIKARLLAVAADPAVYWRIFQAFLAGTVDQAAFARVLARCLPTDEARRLHNQLVRAVLYNARFSPIPPPELVYEREQEQPARSGEARARMA